MTAGIVLADAGYGYDHMGAWGWGWGLMVFWMVLGLVLVGLVIWAVVAAVGRGSAGGDAASSAEEVLAERYARGEIDTEEFERRRRVLRGR